MFFHFPIIISHFYSEFSFYLVFLILLVTWMGSENDDAEEVVMVVDDACSSLLDALLDPHCGKAGEHFAEVVTV